MKGTKWLPLFMLFLPLNCAAAPAAAVEQKVTANIDENRIYIYEYTGRPSGKDIAQYVRANKPKHKEGYMTAAYFFPAGSSMPQEHFKKATSMYVANEYLYNSPEIDPWKYAVIIHFNKKGFIVNCSKNPMDAYCRKTRKAILK